MDQPALRREAVLGSCREGVRLVSPNDVFQMSVSGDASIFEWLNRRHEAPNWGLCPETPRMSVLTEPKRVVLKCQYYPPF